tara:strand:+ start:517 stop:1068 length:552 start_codon:yes stop_codon:yes gene_type:complete
MKMMNLKIISMSFLCLFLGSCGGESGSDTDNSNAAKDPGARKRAMLDIVNSDRLERYSSCVAINASINNILNNDPSIAASVIDVELTLLGPNAHQAAIYSSAVARIRSLYPKEDLGRVDEMRAKWVNENIINKTVTLKQFMSFRDDLCPFYETDSVALDAGELMVEYEGFYKEQYEMYLNIRF